MSDVRVAFDLGAESGRAIVGRFDGERLELSEARRFENRAVRLPDGLYWDALGLYAELCSSLGGIGAAGSAVRSIGIDSWGCDFGLLDSAGALLGSPLHHRDGRGAGAMDTAFSRVPADEIYEQTGIQFLPFNTLFQLVALEGSGRLEAAETLLLIPDLLDFWLSGERVAEATNASTTQLLDVETGGWCHNLIEQLGIPSKLFAEVRPPGEVVGGLLPHVARATRLPESTPLVTVASHDTASAVVAVPFEPRSPLHTSRAGPGRSSGSSSPRRRLEERASSEPHERARLRRQHPPAEERDGTLARPGMPARAGWRRARREL